MFKVQVANYKYRIPKTENRKQILEYRVQRKFYILQKTDYSIHNTDYSYQIERRRKNTECRVQDIALHNGEYRRNKTENRLQIT